MVPVGVGGRGGRLRDRPIMRRDVRVERNSSIPSLDKEELNWQPVSLVPEGGLSYPPAPLSLYVVGTTLLDIIVQREARELDTFSFSLSICPPSPGTK